MTQTVTDLPVIQDFPGFRTPWGITLPPGGRVAAYVRSTGAQSGDDITIGNNLVTTLASGLAKCRANMGDAVIVLPGHSESVADATMLDNLVAGTRIVGVGRGSKMPVFRWTATGSQWVLNDNDVEIYGLRLRMEGANGVVKAIAWTGADCLLANCDIELASGASNKATIGIELGSGADRAHIRGNYVRGTATHNVTDGILVAAAVTDARITSNTMIASATAGNGLIRASAAALSLDISWNRIYNTHTNSTACIAFADVAADGIVCFNCLATTVGTATAPASTGLIFAGTNTLIRAFENYATPTKNTSGDIAPARDT